MNLLTIIPIARAIGRESLTYFSPESPVVGSLVEIPLRNKTVHGIVIQTETVQSKKSEIKSLPYGIKKIEKINAKSFLLPEFVEVAKSVADYYASTTGAVLSVLIPKSILESVESLHSQAGTSQPSTSSIMGEVVALQSDDDERYSTYRGLIREEFAKKKSVFLCLPTREEIKIAKESLQKGIEQYTFVLHNGLTKKEAVRVWNAIMETEHPILVIGTGYFLSLPRTDIRTIILEKENSRAYTMHSRPFLDIRTVAELIAKKMSRKVIYGDTALRVETMFRQKEHEIAEFSPLKQRVLSPAECSISDMRTPRDQEKKEFQSIGSALEQLITQTKENNDNLFLFCARKGLSPITVCSDCGETVSCSHCGAPVTLYGKKEVNEKPKVTDTNFFLCHRCGERRPADVLCVRCNSWRLTTVGVGIEGVEKEMKKRFPDLTVFIMDKDHITTHTQAEKTAQKFADTPGSVMLGTEMAIPYVKNIKNKMGYAGIVSLDSFFSIPDWRMNEKILNIILFLRAIADRTVVVQTRRPDERIFDYALKGNLSDFYRDEIEERKKFGFPPFNTFIKITLQGKKVETRAKMEQMKEHMQPYDVSIFEAFHTGADRQYTVHGLLMLPRGSWPDPTLVAKLRDLSPEYAIRIDPDSLL